MWAAACPLAAVLRLYFAVQEYKYYILAGKPMRYWRSFPVDPSPEFQKLLMFSSLNTPATLACMVLGVIAFLLFLFEKERKRSVAILLIMLVSGLVFLYSLRFITTLD